MRLDDEQHLASSGTDGLLSDGRRGEDGIELLSVHACQVMSRHARVIGPCDVRPEKTTDNNQEQDPRGGSLFMA